MKVPLQPPHARSWARFDRAALTRALVVTLVFGLALLLRVRAAESMALDFDEDDYLRAGQLYAQHLAAGDVGAVLAERENYEHPPLTKLVFGAILLARGPEAYATPLPKDQATTIHRPDDPATIQILAQVKTLRALGVAAGALTAGLVAAVSPLAGLLVALSSWHIKYTSQAMLEALPCLFAACALLTLARSRRNGDRAYWLGAVFLGLTAAGTYRYAAGGFAAIGWLVWRELRAWRERPEPSATAVPPAVSMALAALRAAVPWGLAALLAFYAFDPALWPDPLGRLRESLVFNADFSVGRAVQRAGLPWFQPLLLLLGASAANPGVIPLLLDGAFGLLALLAARRMLREEGLPRLTALWLLANLVFLLFWPTKWSQYIVALTVPASLAAARWLSDARRAWARRPHKAQERHELRRALPWLAPAGLLLLAVAAYPIALQAAVAATNAQAATVEAGQWRFWQAFGRGALALPPLAGYQLDYYGLAAIPSFSSQLLGPLAFNLLWVAVTLALATALGLGLATILNRPGLRWKAAWHALFMLPWAVPEFVAALAWQTIFDDSGALNTLLGTQIKWQSDRGPLLDLRPLAAPLSEFFRTARLAPIGDMLVFLAESLSQPKAFWVLVLAGVWVCFPFMLLVSAMALRSVPDTIGDAARVDGASGWALWREITWPLIAPRLLTGALLRGALLFNAFYLPQLVVGERNLQRVQAVTLALLAASGVNDSNFPFAAFVGTTALLAAALLLWRFDRRTRLTEELEELR
jgi:ABC-type sugar transport system permease subunit